VRTQNEDQHFADPDAGVFVVADGMGGHEDGALASETVVQALRSIGNAVSARDLLARFEDRVITANRKVKDMSDSRGVVVGSTLAAILIFDGAYACAWSGDSRVYMVRDGQIRQLSRDHTEVEELIENGLLTRDEARKWPRRSVITRAIGVAETPDVELEQGALQSGDTFVLCSDGLTNHVNDREILGMVSVGTAQSACDKLVALTLERGATDNVTVVVTRYQQPVAAVRPPPPGRSSGSDDLWT
jgi:protein phosphatase